MVAVGKYMAWIIASDKTIYKRTGSAWTHVQGPALTAISVGKHSVWGVDEMEDVYVDTSGYGHWHKFGGKLIQVSHLKELMESKVCSARYRLVLSMIT